MKRIVLTICLLTMVFASNAFAGADVIKVSYNGPPDAFTNPNHAWASVFKRVVETDSRGKYEVKLFHSSQLGKERDRLNQLKSGFCHVNMASLGGLSQIYPPAYVIMIPYLFSSPETFWWSIDNSQFIKEMKADIVKKTGLRLLDITETGEFNSLTNNLRPIKSMEDFKGIKFRGMDAGQIAFVKALGAGGVPVPWTELYTALQTGVVDGQMNPPTFVIHAKLYEVQKYYTMTRHMLGMQFTMTNEKWLKGLSQEDQRIILRANYLGGLATRGMDQVNESENLAFLKKNGVDIDWPTKELNAKIKKIGQPAYIKWLSERVDKSWIDKALESSAQAEVAVNEMYSKMK